MSDTLRLLTIPEAAKLLGVSKQTVYTLIAQGDVLPIQPTGKQWYVTGLELERYIRETQQRVWDTQATNRACIRKLFENPRGRSGAASRKRKEARV